MKRVPMTIQIKDREIPVKEELMQAYVRGYHAEPKQRYILIYLQEATDDPDISEHLDWYSNEELSAMVNEYLEGETDLLG